MDVQLLSVIAETGRAAVHEIAGRLGMDVREVAARLAALSTTGLPIVVGVECDPQAIHNALAAMYPWNAQQPQAQQPQGPQPPVPPQAYGPAAGPYPPPVPPATPGSPPAQGYPPAQSAPPAPGAPPAQAPPWPANAPGQSGPSGPHSGQSGPSGPQPGQSGPSGPQAFGVPGPQPPLGDSPNQPHAAARPGQPPPPGGPQSPMNTWGPPGSPSWARGDQRPGEAETERQVPAVKPRSGTIGSKLEVDGPEGEQITLQLVEVVDPADFLYTAAGYQLQDGERSVVVHTELTNRGTMPFTSLPDLYLVLIAKDGTTVSKAQVSLSSRPPHQIGVSPGATAGGHTVYVLPDTTELAAVRWSPRPGDDSRTLTWDISDA